MPELPLSAFSEVFHHAPLHYLPAIAASARLLSKKALLEAGFGHTHFRSTSKRQDLERGFGHFIHLTPSSEPRILNAKLKRGFPHMSLVIPVSAFAAVPHALCRFNIAKTRLLRRDGKPGTVPSATNGRYYGDAQIPIATTISDQQAMIDWHHPLGTMLEILVANELALPLDTRVRIYDASDLDLARSVLSRTNTAWSLEMGSAPTYARSDQHAANVEQYIRTAMGSEGWRAPELEFDNL